HHADDPMRNAVERERRANSVNRSAKPELPEAMTDHGHWRAGEIIAAEGAATQGWDAERRKQIIGGDHAIELFRLAGSGQQISPPKDSGQALERSALFFQRFKITIEEGICRLVWPFKIVAQNDHKLIGIFERQRPEQPGIQDAEHGGVGADAKRERENSNPSEAGSLH